MQGSRIITVLRRSNTYKTTTVNENRSNLLLDNASTGCRIMPVKNNHDLTLQSAYYELYIII